jgi:glycerophosphoryl diester phosphodiesterase
VAENSLEAFRAALRRGASGLETDVRLTADGAAVLHHDEHFLRFGVLPTAVRRVGREELPRWVPTIDELYAACGAGYELSVDLKDYAAFDQVIGAAGRAGAVERLWLCAGDVDTLAGWRAREPRVRLCLSSSSPPFPEQSAEEALDRMARARVDALNLRAREWSPDLVARVHGAGMRAFAWDANRSGTLRAVLSMGVDAVHADMVEPVLAAIGGTRGAS